MRKIVIAAAVAVVAVAASTASAGKSAQSYKCNTNKAGAFKDTLHPGQPIPLCVFTKELTGVKLTLTGTQTGITSRSILLTVDGMTDPRTETLPKTYKNSDTGATVTGLFSITKIKIVNHLPAGSKSTSWAVPAGSSSMKFAVTLSSYNALTKQAKGKFSGKMRAGDSNPKAGTLLVSGGTFVGDTTFSGF